MTVHQRPAIDGAALRSWHTDGFLLLRGLLPADIVAGLQRSLERAADAVIADLLAKGSIAAARREVDWTRRLAVAAGPLAAEYGRGWRRAVAHPEIYRLHRCEPLVDAVAALLGADAVTAYPVWNARPKLPNQATTVVPWHQDSGYFGADTARATIITCWIPAVPVDARNGCMQVARGSHRYGLIRHSEEEGSGRFLEIPWAEPDAALVETPAMEPGDVLMLHNLTWHRSLPNRGDHVRWSIDIRYHGGEDHVGAKFHDCAEPWIVRSPSRPPLGEERWLELAGALGW